MSSNSRGSARLPHNASRIVYVKNLPYNVTAEEIYGVFGPYGPIHQVRVGTAKGTKGRAFVVYEDIYDAKNAVEHLIGFSVRGRFIVVLYHKADAARKAAAPTEEEMRERRARLDELRRQHGIEKRVDG